MFEYKIIVFFWAKFIFSLKSLGKKLYPQRTLRRGRNVQCRSGLRSVATARIQLPSRLQTSIRRQCLAFYRPTVWNSLACLSSSLHDNSFSLNTSRRRRLKTEDIFSGCDEHRPALLSRSRFWCRQLCSDLHLGSFFQRQIPNSSIFVACVVSFPYTYAGDVIWGFPIDSQHNTVMFCLYLRRYSVLGMILQLMSVSDINELL